MNDSSQSLTDVDVLLLRHKANQLRRKREELTEGFGLLNYTPHTKQDRFHRAADRPFRAVFAGNRFGKSQCGCAEDCAWLYGERVWYTKGSPERRLGIPRHPVKGLVITTDWDKVDEIWTSERGQRPGKLWQLLPGDFVKSKRRNHSGAIETVECANGSLLSFDTVRSYLTNTQGAESSDWDFIHIDEPCPEGMYKAAARGLVDRGGYTWFTLTALSEPWIVDLFASREKAANIMDVESFDEGDFWMIRGEMRDNPYLTEEAIRRYEALLTEEEKDCRMKGIPLALAGLVYKEFDYDRHVLKSVPEGWTLDFKPPLNWPIYVGIDPHPETAHAFLAATVSPKGQIIFFREHFEKMTISEYCQLFKDLYRDYHVMWSLCDPSAWINDPITGGNIADEFSKEKIYVDKATKALSQGIIHARSELKLQNKIYFSPYLSETLWEIQRYCWDMRPERRNKPVDKDDHMMENMYRILLSEPVWVDLKTVRELDRPVGDLVIDRSEIDFNEEISLAL